MGENSIVNTMGTNAPEVVNEQSRLFGHFSEENGALHYQLGAEKLCIAPWGEAA